MNTEKQIHGWWSKAARAALIAAGAWQMTSPLAQAQPANRAQVVVEKKVPESTLYRTGRQNIYVAPKGGADEVAATLAAANGNVYAAAINNGNTARGLTVVHEGGRTLLVSGPSSPLLKTVRARQPAPRPGEATQLASSATPVSR